MSVLPCPLKVFTAFGLATLFKKWKRLGRTGANAPVLCLLVNLGLLDATETSPVSVTAASFEAARFCGVGHSSRNFIDNLHTGESHNAIDRG